MSRARECAEELIGQCLEGLEDVATDEEMHDPAFLAEFDLLAFHCDGPSLR